jgi:hypothetical protein
MMFFSLADEVLANDQPEGASSPAEFLFWVLVGLSFDITQPHAASCPITFNFLGTRY